MGHEFQITIESMAPRGYGVGRIDGKIVFVPYSVKGEEAAIEIAVEKKDYSIGKIRRIITPSPSRARPPCPVFGRCGGCQWQHIDYGTQVEFKREILEETLRRLGRLHEIPPIAVVSSSHPYGYRARVQLKGRQGRIGYYRERSHRIIPIDHCPIAHPLINQIIPLLNDCLPFFSKMEEVEINVSPDEGGGVLLLHRSSLSVVNKELLEEVLRKYPIVKGIATAGKEGLEVFGRTDLIFTVSSRSDEGNRALSLHSSPGSFFQIDPDQNLRLIHTVVQFGDVRQGEKVLDLYAGIGNFSLPLALEGAEVIGIEENEEAVRNARTNALTNAINRCRFIQGKVEDLLQRPPLEGPDLIVLDPPRTGCKDIIPDMVSMDPKKIVYVSCDPATFSRDLRLLSDRGYLLRRLALIDLFPQTYHMETVGLLKKQ